MNNTTNSKDTAINIRTSEDIKRQFNDMVLGGATQTEKFEYLMKLYNETVEQQAYLDINVNISSMKSKFDSIVAELGEIQSNAQKWQNSVKDIYVNGLGNEFNVLKESIEFDEELKKKVEDLEHKLEKQLERNDQLKNINESYSTKVKELERENADLKIEKANAINQLSEVQLKAINDTKRVIELETKLESKIEQYENAAKELAEAREYKYRAEQLEKELETIKHSKESKNQAKDKEIDKLKTKIKELEAAAKVEPKTTKTTKTTNK